jgi:hypothetical protein
VKDFSGFHDHFTDSIQDSETERGGTFSHLKLSISVLLCGAKMFKKLHTTVFEEILRSGVFYDLES